MENNEAIKANLATATTQEVREVVQAHGYGNRTLALLAVAELADRVAKR